MKIKQCYLNCKLVLGVLILVCSSCKKDDNGTSTLTDSRDGNIYKTVTIGKQVWMAENLRYSGDIPQVNNSWEWYMIFDNATQEPAWCYYNNNPDNDGIYGKLYNWHALNTVNLCPTGWHIPTDAEWLELANYLGGEQVAGGKMKSTTGWTSPNINANNKSGFSGLPGGQRDPYGDFTDFGSSGFWWSATIDTDYGPNAVIHRYLSSSNGNLGTNTYYYGKERGMSVRCLKDN